MEVPQAVFKVKIGYFGAIEVHSAIGRRELKIIYGVVSHSIGIRMSASIETIFTLFVDEP
jgi:hypothetical protein